MSRFIDKQSARVNELKLELEKLYNEWPKFN